MQILSPSDEERNSSTDSLELHPDLDYYGPMFDLLEAAGAGFVKVFPWDSKEDSPGKAPIGKAWNKSPYTLDQVTKHYLRGGNIGLLCGHNQLFTLDADAEIPQTTAGAIVAALPALADTLTTFRDTAPDRAKFLVRMVDGDPLPASKSYSGFEILSINKEGTHAGKQAVIAGTHAGNGKDVPPAPLRWRCTGGKLLEVTAAQVAALVATVTGKPAPEPSFVLPFPPPIGFGVDDLDELNGLAADLEEGGGKAAHPLRGVPIATRRRKHIDRAVSEELAQLRGVTVDRNRALNDAAFTLGTLFAAVGESTGEVEAKLLSVALEIGLDENEATKTIRSGLEAGEKRPRDLPSWWNDAGDDDPRAAAGDDDAGGDDAPAAGGQQQGKPARPNSWPYGGSDGRLVYFYEIKGEPAESKIADFTARNVEEITEENGARTFTIAGDALRGGAFRLEIPAEVFGQPRTLRAMLESAAGAKDPVYPGMTEHLPAAIKLLTRDDELVSIKRFRRTGWHDGRFLIPGREPDGVTLTLPPKLPYSCPPAAQLSEGLRGLAAVLRAPGDLGRGAALVSFVLQGPAAKPAGLHNERYALFVTGRTGSLKTSTVQAAMAIYGAGWADDTRLLKWGEGATRNAIMAYSTHAHDLPFILDNYKPNTGDGAGGAVALLHNIVEGSDRDRMGRDTALRTSKSIAAWPLCTGEDIPSGDAAAIARILVLPFNWQRGTENAALSEAQGLAQHMPAVGAAWLEWLEGDGAALAAEAGKQFGPMRTRWAGFLRKAQPDMVNVLRVASNLASNQLVFLLACEHPEIGPILRPFRDNLDAALQDIGRSMGGLTVESLEAERWLSHLRALVASGRAAILDVNEFPATIAAAQATNKLIGYRDGAGVYVLPTPATAAVVALAGKDAINGISAGTLYKQLVEIGAIASQGKDKLSIVKKINGAPVRVIHLRADILTEEETAPEEGEPGYTRLHAVTREV
jgi:hypothetical protein